MKKHILLMSSLLLTPTPLVAFAEDDNTQVEEPIEVEELSEEFEEDNDGQEEMTEEVAEDNDDDPNATPEIDEEPEPNPNAEGVPGERVMNPDGTVNWLRYTNDPDIWSKHYTQDTTSMSTIQGALSQQQNRKNAFADRHAQRIHDLEEAARRAREVVHFDKLNSFVGVVMGPSGEEIYHNLDMNQIVQEANAQGIPGSYNIREDGVQMLDNLVIVSAKLESGRPIGTQLETTLGPGIVLNNTIVSGGDDQRISIATNWPDANQFTP